MRVLLVDDEPKLLEAVQRMLFHLEPDWEVESANSGEEALALLEEEYGEAPFDVIITDMRMPGMDGAELLTQVHARYPDMARIVLSGYAEVEATLRTLPVAHQFLCKPCRAKLLREVIKRACQLRTVLSDDAVRGTIGKIDRLPSVPRIYAELTSMLANENTNAGQVGTLISQDPAMCAKILQLVNSSFFARARNVSDVRQAVVRLGMTLIKNLALSAEVFRPLKIKRKIKWFSIDNLQQRSMQTAMLARELLEDRALAEDAFTASILHDVGTIVMAAELPDSLAAAEELAKAEGVPRHVAEREIMGTTHAELGAHLLATWGLPYPIVEAVANHHDPRRVDKACEFGLLEAVYVAQAIIAEEPMDPDYLEELGITDRLARWQSAERALAAS